MENDYSSISKLVEFGIDASIATNMIKNMNLAFDNMIVPGSMSNYLSSNHNIQPFTPSYSWYLGINKQPIGPLCEAELIERLIKHQIDKDTLAWRIGMTKWEPIKSIPEILKLILLLPPSL